MNHGVEVACLMYPYMDVHKVEYRYSSLVCLFMCLVFEMCWFDMGHVSRFKGRVAVRASTFSSIHSGLEEVLAVAHTQTPGRIQKVDPP